MTINKIPSVAAIAQAHELGRSSASVMSFLYSRVLSVFKKFKVEKENATVMDAIATTKNMADLRAQFCQVSSSKCWNATATRQDMDRFKPDSITYLDAPAIAGVQELNHALGEEHHISEVVMAYYIDENGMCQRGYVVNQQPIIDDKKNAEHKKMIDVLDLIFGSWLTSNGMSADKAGFIYAKDSEGNYTQKIDPDELRRLIDDPENGFRFTIEKIDPNINFSLIWVSKEDQERAEEFTQSGSEAQAQP